MDGSNRIIYGFSVTGERPDEEVNEYIKFFGAKPVILHRNNIVRGMQHNLLIDSNPEADTRHHVLLLTFSGKKRYNKMSGKI